MARSPTQFSSAAERERKLAEAKKNRGSESRGYDLTPAVEKAKAVGRNIKTRSDRAYLAGISGMGAAALGASGVIGKAIGHKSASGDLTRARGALKDVGKFAKAAVIGEPEGEKYLKTDKDQPYGSLGRYYMRGSDVDWEKKEPKKKATGGKVQTSADTARKLATEMGGMKKGGKPKSGLAVMIAIGSPMKKPVKKAVGGAGKTRKGMAPEKLAQGGAGKVRKGMMTPEGKIINVMNKIRGK